MSTPTAAKPPAKTSTASTPAATNKAGTGKTSPIASTGRENTLMRGQEPANNNSMGDTHEQRSGIKPTVPQTAQAEAAASVENLNTVRHDIDPKVGGAAPERGKKTEAAIDTAGVATAASKTGVESHSTAAPQPAKSLDQSERIALVRQVADQIGGSSLKAGNNQVTVRLHPDDWGSVNVRISVTPASQAGGSAQVTAHLVAESPSVKAALDSNMNELRKALAGAGLHLQDAVVSVQAASSAAQSGSTGSGNGNGSHHNPGSWEGGAQTTGGSQQGQGGFTGFTGGGQGSNGQSRPGYPASTVDAVDTAPIPSTPAPSKVNGRLDTRA